VKTAAYVPPGGAKKARAIDDGQGGSGLDRRYPTHAERRCPMKAPLLFLVEITRFEKTGGIDRLANHRQSIPRLLDEAADRPQPADRAFHYEVWV
jgi:hypothetical protein